MKIIILGIFVFLINCGSYCQVSEQNGNTRDKVGRYKPFYFNEPSWNPEKLKNDELTNSVNLYVLTILNWPTCNDSLTCQYIPNLLINDSLKNRIPNRLSIKAYYLPYNKSDSSISINGKIYPITTSHIYFLWVRNEYFAGPIEESILGGRILTENQNIFSNPFTPISAEEFLKIYENIDKLIPYPASRFLKNNENFVYSLNAAYGIGNHSYILSDNYQKISFPKATFKTNLASFKMVFGNALFQKEEANNKLLLNFGLQFSKFYGTISSNKILQYHLKTDKNNDPFVDTVRCTDLSEQFENLKYGIPISFSLITNSKNKLNFFFELGTVLNFYSSLKYQVNKGFASVCGYNIKDGYPILSSEEFGYFKESEIVKNTNYSIKYLDLDFFTNLGIYFQVAKKTKLGISLTGYFRNSKFDNGDNWIVQSPDSYNSLLNYLGNKYIPIYNLNLSIVRNL